MATQAETAEYILHKLGGPPLFSLRRMFGEYALYANAKTVGFICDDMLYVKMVTASQGLGDRCETGPAYPGSKPYYIIEDSLIGEPELKLTLLQIADSRPAKMK